MLHSRGTAWVRIVHGGNRNLTSIELIPLKAPSQNVITWSSYEYTAGCLIHWFMIVSWEGFDLKCVIKIYFRWGGTCRELWGKEKSFPKENLFIQIYHCHYKHIFVYKNSRDTYRFTGGFGIFVLHTLWPQFLSPPL